MKVKKYLSVLAVVCAGALTLAGCSDYDNGYTENAIKFQEEFKGTFGDIDPDQDWNMAERATVTVNTQRESNIKIYALSGNSYSIVGNYQGVTGTQMLGVDVIEGTRNLLVTDGRTAQKCAPGDVVVFNSMSTRTVYENTSSDAFVKVEKLKGDVTLEDGETYLQYRESTAEEIQGMLNTIPQGENNLSKVGVAHDFTYVSTGSFIIYPYYWYTISQNTLGLYYYDENDVKHEVDIYKGQDRSDQHTNELWYLEKKTTGPTLWDNLKDWEISDGNGTVKIRDFGGDDEGDASDITHPYTEVWTSSSLGSMTISKEFDVSNDLAGTEFLVEARARIRNQHNANSIGAGRIYFKANGASITLASNYVGTIVGTEDTYSYSDNNGNNQTQANLYANMDGQGKMWLKCKSNENRKITVSFVLEGVDANWFSFKDVKLTALNPNSTDWEATNSHEYFSTTKVKGQGIKVDIPKDTKFGMYLKKKEYSGPYAGDYTIYSEGNLNETNRGLVGDNNEYPSCYASTFEVGNQMFIGFEDWPGATGGDYDLNDMVFAFDGCKPVIIEEEPTNTWMLACEDLGGSFDVDYNDVIFKVKHVSGETTATVTPIAAGGTLASYIFYVPASGSEQCLGEIHQLFGFEPAVSGEYEAHNVVIGGSYGEGTEGTPTTITVPADWSMAYYSTDTYGLPQTVGTGDEVDAGYQNMGGFEIRTLPKGTEAIANASANWSNITKLSSGASRIPAPNRGEAPYIICIPYSYVETNTPSYGQKTETFWAWPGEFMHIQNCYPDFPKWVSNHRTYGEWYKNRTEGSPTVEEKKVISSMSNINTGNNNGGGGGSTADFTTQGRLTNHYNSDINGSGWDWSNASTHAVTVETGGRVRVWYDSSKSVTCTSTNSNSSITTFTWDKPIWEVTIASPAGSVETITLSDGSSSVTITVTVTAQN